MKRLEQVISIQVKTKLRVVFKLVSKDLKNSVIKIMEVYQREKNSIVLQYIPNYTHWL